MPRCLYLEVRVLLWGGAEPAWEPALQVSRVNHSLLPQQSEARVSARLHHEQRRHVASQKPLQAQVVRQRAQRAQRARLLPRCSRGSCRRTATKSRSGQPRGRVHSGRWVSAAVSESQERTAAALQKQESEKQGCRGRSRRVFP